MKIIILLLALFSIIFLSAVNQSELVYEQLADDKGWENLKEDGATFFRRKPMTGFDLYALEIRRVTSIEPEAVYAVLLDVASYGEVLGDNKYLEAEEVSRDTVKITGYQYARIPLIPNRHYLFDFDLTDYRRSLQEKQNRLAWKLLDPEGEFKKFVAAKDLENNNPIYIRNGAGIWMIREISPGRYENIYRLYIDPAGWMPGWLVNSFNVKNLKQLFDQVLSAAAKG
ncbi:MAG: hypothetical protein K9N06_12970 [Candidatus Cloacimonetes bacterium]|nr:hypothetical protein [Candidatus Cloacimonadota bacterium]